MSKNTRNIYNSKLVSLEMLLSLKKKKSKIVFFKSISNRLILND